MKVICNTSPIIGLLSIGRLPLLWELFDDVLIPQAVYDELCADTVRHKEQVRQLQTCIEQGKLTVCRIENSQMVKAMYGKLHYGELEVIVGAKERQMPLAIIDEIAARRMASEFLIDTIGIMGILILAKKKALIHEIKPELELLQKQGYRISDKLLEETLRKAGEL